LLGRRRVEVGVGVVVVRVGVIVVVVISVGVVLLVLVLVLLLWVLLIGAPRRTIIRRHSIVDGDILLGGLVGWQVILAGRQAAWKLDGAVRHFLCRSEEKGMMDEEEE
jgi:hypothetical protein